MPPAEKGWWKPIYDIRMAEILAGGGSPKSCVEEQIESRSDEVLQTLKSLLCRPLAVCRRENAVASHRKST